MNFNDKTDAFARRVRISGPVQGVGFRAWAAQTAIRLNLDGWVRNRNDGTVELVAVGPEMDVLQLIKACQTGPRMARVDTISTEETPGIVAKGFAQKPTV